MFAQAERQLPKRLEDLTRAKGERQGFAKLIQDRLGKVENDHSKMIGEIVNALGCDLSDWEVEFVQGISARVASGNTLSEKQLSRLKELWNKSKGWLTRPEGMTQGFAKHIRSGDRPATCRDLPKMMNGLTGSAGYRVVTTQALARNLVACGTVSVKGSLRVVRAKRVGPNESEVWTEAMGEP